ncbi:hypothetical protein Q1695_001485 [Nippostrongylus brasiliensis]|nr:hypothetical protein Q1695_001485 [Nippostrongylus brasiliensis]
MSAVFALTFTDHLPVLFGIPHMLSIKNLLTIQKRTTVDENEHGTALHRAVQMGNAVMAKSLLDNRTVWVDEEDGRGRTALHYSMEQNSFEVVEALVNGGANLDCVDYHGTSACHLACREGKIDALELLMAHRADAFCVDKAGKTPFDLACEFGKEKMVEFMLMTVDNPSLLRHAGDAHKASALHLAARNGHTHIVCRLLENGWDINRTTVLGSALHEASGYGRAQVVRFLLHAGINSSLTNAAGLTALEYAKKNAHRNPITFKEIRFLLKECKNFVYGQAVEQHRGVRADELSFDEGDLVWVIDRRQSPEGRWKGVVFGQKGNSRSGHFQSSTVKIVQKPETVISMSSRIAVSPFQGAAPASGRQAKKVSLPVVPNMIGMDRSKCEDVNRNVRSNLSCRSMASPSRMSDDRSSDSQNCNRVCRPGIFGTHSSSSFSNYGTEVGQLLGTKNGEMTSLAFPSTSVLPDPSHRISTGSNSSQGSSGFESMKSHGTTSASSSSSSFHTTSLLTPSHTDSPPSRISVHSSGSGGSGSSSLASSSVDALDDSFYSSSSDTPVNVTQMVAKGVPEAEILALWLDKIGMTEYLALFLTQGYDLSSIARITPEDLLSLGITNPAHRKRLINEIHSWQITDSWPSVPPQGGLSEWLTLLALPEYINVFDSQGYDSVQEVMKLSWEDFEDIGVKRLGHLKRLGLAIKKLKDYRRLMNNPVDTLTNSAKSHSVQVPSPLLSARSVAPTSVQEHSMPAHPRQSDPPPPAPSSAVRGKANLNGNIDYLSYSRGSKNAPAPPVRANEECATFSELRRSSKGSYDPIFERIEPIRLNLVSTGKILSEASRERDTPSVLGAPNADCPPPPAPLHCEGSIRRLQHAFQSSANSSGGSSSSLEQLPFANENCGTIKSRDNAARKATTSVSQTHTPRKALPISIPDCSSSNCEKSLHTVGPNGNVLSDIGFMLQNLTDELDAMLDPAKPPTAKMPPLFPVTK